MDKKYDDRYKLKIEEVQDRLEIDAKNLLKLFDPATIAGLLFGAAVGLLLETKGEEAVSIWLDGLAEEWRDRRPPVEKISMQ